MRQLKQLEGSELDIAVGDAIGLNLFHRNSWPYYANAMGYLVSWHPSTSWNQGGPLVFQYSISLNQLIANEWYASTGHLGVQGAPSTLVWATGRTPLIAAMRTLVLRKDK